MSNHPRTFRLVLSTITALAVVGGCIDYSNFGSGGGGDFLATGVTRSHFRAIQVDPQSEDSAGPQFVAAADLNGDGFLDLVSAWNQSQPVQIHLQRRTSGGTISFETLTLAGNIPVVRVSGLAVADFDGDGRPDIAVLAQETLLDGAGCPGGATGDDAPGGLILTYMGPDDPARANQALAWQEVQIGASFLLGGGSVAERPEDGGYTSMVVGDVDLDGDVDIVVAWNGCDSMAVLQFVNGGRTLVRDGTWSLVELPTTISARDAAAMIKDVALADIDGDADLDVVLTRPSLSSPSTTAMNIRWLRNPARDIPDDYHLSNGQWQVGTVAQISTDADIIRLADIDRDGITDVVVRSSQGSIVQWLKGPANPTSQPLRSIPWQVYTLAEFKERPPLAIALGDLSNNGRVDLVASAGGGLAWFNSASAPTVYDQWGEVLIIDDETPGSSSQPTSTDPSVNDPQLTEGSAINSLLVVDLDGDGRNDIIATLDRGGLSGLSTDALVWFRNTRPR